MTDWQTIPVLTRPSRSFALASSSAAFSAKLKRVDRPVEFRYLEPHFVCLFYRFVFNKLCIRPIFVSIHPQKPMYVATLSVGIAAHTLDSASSQRSIFMVVQGNWDTIISFMDYSHPICSLSLSFPRRLVILAVVTTSHISAVTSSRVPNLNRFLSIFFSPSYRKFNALFEHDACSSVMHTHLSYLFAVCVCELRANTWNLLGFSFSISATDIAFHPIVTQHKVGHT